MRFHLDAPRFSYGYGRGFTYADSIRLYVDDEMVPNYEHPELFSRLAEHINSGKATSESVKAILERFFG